MKKPLLGVLAALALTVLAPVAARAAGLPTYRFEDLGSRGFSQVWDINNVGGLVGFSNRATGAAVWTDGSFHQFFPSVCCTGAYALNDAGVAAVWGDIFDPVEIRMNVLTLKDNVVATLPYGPVLRVNASNQAVGASAGFNSDPKGAFFFDGVSITWLPYGSNSSVWALNNAGAVAYMADGPSGLGGYLWQNGQVGFIAPDFFPTSINDAGVLSGFLNPVGERACAAIIDGGVTTNLCQLDPRAIAAREINNRGLAIGYLEGVGAFVYRAGEIADVRTLITNLPPGVVGFEVLGMNDRDELVGWYQVQGGAEAGFLLSPVPEPAQYAYLLLGVLAVAGVARSHQRT